MNTQNISRVSRAAAGLGLVLGWAAAHAAGGYTVTKAQESLVAPGMTASQVVAELGHPERSVHFRNEPGRTLTYAVTGDPNLLFDVDFDRNGKVLSTSERLEERG